MYGEGRQQLRDYIINKRANEGLGDIPEDLFAKKPHHEMTDEELQSMMERRKRNKEAAERSRKKKKVEFEKLQNENDQLNQDKCELVAMVQKLKTDIDTMSKENETLRENFEHLKRWIGKRSVELGLIKYIPNEQNKGDLLESEASPDDHLKYDSDGSVSTDNRNADCGQPSSPKRRRVSKEDSSQPAPRPQVQAPWCVEPVSSRKEKPAGESSLGTLPQPLPQPSAPPLPESQPYMLTNGQPIVYLPKDAVIVFQGGDQRFLKGNTEPHPVLRASPKIAVEPPEAQGTELPRMSSGMASLSRSVGAGQAALPQPEKEAKGASFRDIPTDMDPAKATAIESLLRLGCKIQMPPEPSMDWVQNRTCEA